MPLVRSVPLVRLGQLVRSVPLVHLGSVTALVVACAAGCASDAPAKRTPAPVAAPALCTQVVRGSDTLLGEVPCRGMDADRDGIDDAVDACPDDPEVKNGLFDRDGCPDPDTDDDGLLDDEDACPKKPGPPPDGCPPADADQDGLADHLDRCPHQAEDLDGEDDADGCPEGQNLAKRKVDAIFRHVVLEMQPGASKVGTDGRADLEDVADELLGRTDAVRRVRVAAYASKAETRSGKKAKRLAKRRAAAVTKRLVAGGIPLSVVDTWLIPLGRRDKAGPRVEVTVFLDEHADDTAKTAQTAEVDWDAEFLESPF